MVGNVVTRPELPNETVSFAKRQIRDAQFYKLFDRRIDRRSETRHSMAVPVLVQPVDEQFNPVGESFAVVTRDLSATGIGLIHSRPIDHKLLALQLQLAGEEVNVIVEVAWCKPMGPFEYLGGRFISRLERFPQQTERDGGPHL